MKNFRLQLVLMGLLICLSTQVSFSQTPIKKNDGKVAQAAAPITQKYSLYFDIGKDKIKPEGYKALDSLVSLLQTNPNVRRIQVNGYADTTGGAEANLELSNRRTDTVSNYITGKGLMKFKVKFASAFFGETATGKEADLSEMRRVDVVLYMARPDRDTIIKSGCASVKIKANTFENYNNDELVFSFIYVESADDMKKYNLSNLDNEGNKLLSAGMFKVTATFKGKPVKGILPVEVELPMANHSTDYDLYTGVEEKNKPVTWKLTDKAIANNRSTFSAGDKSCYTSSINNVNLNIWHNADKKFSCGYCNADPFGGLETPDKTNNLARFGDDKTIVVLNESCFKKMDASSTYMQVVDGLYPNEYLNFCNSFLLPGVGNVPQIPKFDREIVKFIDFNVSQKNDTADMIMVKKTKVLIMIPKSKFPAHEGKQYAILPADTKKDNFFDWTTKIVFNDACQGLANCDYWIFEAPFSGFYSLLELTPLEKGSSKTVNADSDNGDVASTNNCLKIKSKKFNNVLLIYGAKDEDKTTTASFIKNKGKHSFNQSFISKKEKKAYSNHVFMAYVVVNGKRYAWIGKGSELKTNFITGNWKTPKLVYVPDEQWEEFVKKACE
jgi:hypothetical protein